MTRREKFDFNQMIWFNNPGWVTTHAFTIHAISMDLHSMSDCYLINSDIIFERLNIPLPTTDDEMDELEKKHPELEKIFLLDESAMVHWKRNTTMAFNNASLPAIGRTYAWVELDVKENCLIGPNQIVPFEMLKEIKDEI